MQTIRRAITEAYQSAEDKTGFLNELRQMIHEEFSTIKQPVDLVRWVPIEDVKPNDYNPNAVAKQEMGLLYRSIKHDGYTQPVVVVEDQIKGKYVIVDGFHRYFTAKMNPDINERNAGRIPVTVISKDINDRMAATVRHNRARGKHSVAGMGKMVFSMLHNGWTEAEICNELGMEPEEVLKLKHVTGFSKLFANKEYSRSWETRRMIKLRLEQETGEEQA